MRGRSARILLLTVMLLLCTMNVSSRKSRKPKAAAVRSSPSPSVIEDMSDKAHPETLALAFRNSFSPAECAEILASGEGELKEANVGNTDSGKIVKGGGKGVRAGEIRSTCARKRAASQAAPTSQKSASS